MSSSARKLQSEARGADPPMDDLVQAHSIQGDEPLGLPRRPTFTEEVPNTSQVAGPFLSHRCDDPDGGSHGEVDLHEDPGQRQEGGQSAPVVGDPRRCDPLALPPGCHVGLSREDRVQMGGDDEGRLRGSVPGGPPGRDLRQDIARVVTPDPGPARFGQERRHPLAPGTFPKGGSGDRGELDLPLEGPVIAGLEEGPRLPNGRKGQESLGPLLEGIAHHAGCHFERIRVHGLG